MAFHRKMGVPKLQHQQTRRLNSPTECCQSTITGDMSTMSSTTSLRIKSSFLSSQLVYILSILVILVTGCPSITNAEASLTIKQPIFTSWNQNVTYASSTKYSPRGMGPLYNTTNDVLDIFIGENAIPPGYIVVSEQKIEFGKKVHDNEWGDLLKHYWGILLVVVVGALLIALMPIIGLCFCCCRCAGACGGRSQPFDKKHDTCRRVFLGLLLICAATALLFGVVVAFVTNSYMQEGVEDTPMTAGHAIDDVQLFLNSTSAQIKYLLDQNYKELSHCLLFSLNDTQDKVINDLKELSKAISLELLITFVKKLPAIHQKLIDAKNITNNLRVTASQLSDALRGVKRDLLVTLNNCGVKECTDVLESYEIGKLDANGIDYNQLPDLTPIIQGVEVLKNSEASQKIIKGEDALKDLEEKLRESINAETPKIEKAIKDAGETIRRSSNDIERNLVKISNTLKNNSTKYINLGDEYIKKYSVYRFYGGIAISSVLLLVLVSVTFALFCGVCGKRPDGYGDDCCNKGSGSRFLMLAVTVIFLTISILAAVVLVHFLVGLILHRAVCIPLNNPNDQLFGYIDDYVDLNKVLYPKTTKTINDDQPLRISGIIDSCRRNKTIYNILRLYNIYNVRNLQSMRDEFHIDEKLEELVKSIKIGNLTILEDEAEEAIKTLKDSALKDFASYKFIDNLNDTVTNRRLNEVADELEKTAKKIHERPGMENVRSTLLNQALHLRSYEVNLVQPIVGSTQKLIDIVKSLESDLKMGNSSSFEENIEKLLNDTKNAQDFINHNGTEAVQDIARNLTARFTNYIEKYVNRVIHAVEEEIGQCAPIMNVYDATVVATCNKIVDPFNGFWAGVAWCVIIFLPTLIISVKLSSLYQKSDPYPGPLVESEYLYDAYSERDNIPLANGPKNKKRKQKARRHGSRDRRGDYYEDSGSSHGAPSGRDTRYSDMAPKHWDGGPPRYQNPPMAPPASEYERPPPYYYPGAPSDQD